MDISKETDVTVLKALAYDELQKLNIAQSNVQLLQQRIAQLQEHDSILPVRTRQKS